MNNQEQTVIPITVDDMATILTLIDFFVNMYMEPAIKEAPTEEKKKKYIEFHGQLLKLKSTLTTYLFFKDQMPGKDKLN